MNLIISLVMLNKISTSPPFFSVLHELFYGYALGLSKVMVVEKKGRGLHGLQGAMKPFTDPQSKVYILFLLLLKIAHQ